MNDSAEMEFYTIAKIGNRFSLIYRMPNGKLLPIYAGTFSDCLQQLSTFLRFHLEKFD
nr:hypothetical protein PECWAHUG_PECWAHUG_CDS_0019 [Microvirus sp.]